MTRSELKNIKHLWKEYENETVLRVMKEGKWSTIPLKGKSIPRITATQAKVVKLKDVMSFPKYLEQYEKATN